MLQTVTLTGADDSVMPQDLFNLQQKYPFVEWGILVSQNITTESGQTRYPSKDWLLVLEGFQKHLINQGNPLNLSLHVCGSWVRWILTGQFDFIDALGLNFVSQFQRIQLNTHGRKHNYDPSIFAALTEILPNTEWIFQNDGKNDDLIHDAKLAGLKMAVLFDKSSGAGILPNSWPNPIPGIKCGYAGGLDPQSNLLYQVVKIFQLVPYDNPFWVDMETHLFDKDQKKFDLHRCEMALHMLDIQVAEQFKRKTVEYKAPDGWKGYSIEPDALETEPTFTLHGSDDSASHIVLNWISENLFIKDDQTLQAAFTKALAMKNYYIAGNR